MAAVAAAVSLVGLEACCRPGDPGSAQQQLAVSKDQQKERGLREAGPQELELALTDAWRWMQLHSSGAVQRDDLISLAGCDGTPERVARRGDDGFDKSWDGTWGRRGLTRGRPEALSHSRR